MTRCEAILARARRVVDVLALLSLVIAFTLVAACEDAIAGGAPIQVRRMLFIPYELECWAPQDLTGVWRRYRPELVLVVRGVERENLGTVVPGTCVRVWESDAPFYRLKCKDHPIDFPGSWLYSGPPADATKGAPTNYSQPSATGCWQSEDFTL